MSDVTDGDGSDAPTEVDRPITGPLARLTDDFKKIALGLFSNHDKVCAGDRHFDQFRPRPEIAHSSQKRIEQLVLPTTREEQLDRHGIHRVEGSAVA